MLSEVFCLTRDVLFFFFLVIISFHASGTTNRFSIFLLLHVFGQALKEQVCSRLFSEFVCNFCLLSFLFLKFFSLLSFLFFFLYKDFFNFLTLKIFLSCLSFFKLLILIQRLLQGL